jgi:hypothetical protein
MHTPQPLLRILHPLPPAEPLHLDETALSEIERRARTHNLLMLVYVQLQKYYNEISQSSTVDTYLKQRKTLFLSHAVHSMRQEAMEKEILQLLGAEQIPAIVMKGNEIAKEIYNDPNCRTSSDIDILIKMSDALRADALLTKAGYLRMDKSPLRFWFKRMHHAQYMHAKNKALIEIHWNFGIPSFFKLTSEDIWDEVTCNDAGHYKLSPDMMVISLLVHHHMHAFRELKILVDVLWALHTYENQIDWPAFAEKLEKIGLIKITRITLGQIKGLWEDSAQKMQGLQALDQEITKIGYAEPAFLQSYFKMDVETHGPFQNKKDIFVFRLALDRWPTILFSFAKSLVPFPESIKDLYEDPRNRTLPKNYVKFIKWRLQEWTRSP